MGKSIVVTLTMIASLVLCVNLGQSIRFYDRHKIEQLQKRRREHTASHRITVFESAAPILTSTFNSADKDDQQEREALIQLFEATNGHFWLNNRNWLSNTSICNWAGVSCAAGRVAVLNLGYNNLDGQLPSDAFHGLAHVTTLSLSSNRLFGPIPDLSPLQNLRTLILVSNQFSGSVPPLDRLRLLENLYLYSNRLSDQFPPLQSLANLTFFSAFGNAFSGTLPSLPSRVEYVDLDSNSIGGTISQSFVSPLRHLVKLIVFDNDLEGPLPDFSGSPNMVTLYAYNNRISGSLPSFDRNPALAYIDLSFNNIEGPLPSFSKNPLELLYLSSNRLSGSLPSLRHLPKLINLALAQNRFTGSIPSGLLSPSITLLDVSLNEFEGDLSFVAQLPKLVILDISFNHWRIDAGTLDSIAVLPPSLTTLSATGCGFSGSLPAAWAQSNLTTLHFAQNRIALPLPRFTRLKELDLASNHMNCDMFTLVQPLWDPYSQPPITNLQLVSLEFSNMSLFGGLPPMLFYPFYGTLFSGLRELFLDHNGFNSKLPSVDFADQPLAVLDLSYTNIFGPIPGRWIYFIHLDTLRLSNTQLSDAGSSSLAFIRARSDGEVIQNTTFHYQCPALVLTLNYERNASLTLDPQYHNFSLCSCMANYFGIPPMCQPCPDFAGQVCNCHGRMISDCFPAFDPVDAVAMPVILPCRPVSFELNPCNPGLISMPNNNSFDQWCAQGYTGNVAALFVCSHPVCAGRLCSQCDAEYFSWGTTCSHCPDNWLAVLGLVLQIALVLLIAIFLYQRDPVAGTARMPLPSTDNAALRILAFHGQLLGSLVSTRIVLPPELGALFSTSAAATSFSLSSFFAYECLLRWSLKEWVRAALALPFVTLAVAATVYFCVRGCLQHSQRAIFPFRLGRLLIALLNLLYFPLAFTFLSGLGCTDFRQRDRVFLNLYPWQACDHVWWTSIFPYAIIGFILCVIGLPALVVMVWCYFYRIGSRDRLGVTLGDLFKYFRDDVPMCRFWELAVILRRILIVIVQAFVPLDSPYVPVAIFLILQSSALAQQRVRPYRSEGDNYSELASLYLLLLCYFTGLIAMSSPLNSVRVWFYVLLAGNLALIAFLLLRIARMVIADCVDQCAPIDAMAPSEHSHDSELETFSEDGLDNGAGADAARKRTTSAVPRLLRKLVKTVAAPGGQQPLLASPYSFDVGNLSFSRPHDHAAPVVAPVPAVHASESKQAQGQVVTV